MPRRGAASARAARLRSADVVVHGQPQRAHVGAGRGVGAGQLELVAELTQAQLLAHGEAVALGPRERVVCAAPPEDRLRLDDRLEALAHARLLRSAVEEVREVTHGEAGGGPLCDELHAGRVDGGARLVGHERWSRGGCPGRVQGSQTAGEDFRDPGIFRSLPPASTQA
eukprot:scaffold56621_cov54-Phaeocystis_antarctica.AAC.1